MAFSWMNIADSGFALVGSLVVVGAAVVIAGTKLARYADALGEVLNLSRAWIGLLFLAVITSVPELVTSLGAVTVVDGVDIAMGNLFGSNLFNLMIIVVLDVVQGPGPIMLQASPRQSLTAAGSVLLMAVAAMGVALGVQAESLPDAFGPLFGLALILIYVILLRLSFRSEQSQGTVETPAEANAARGRVFLGFAVSGAVIIASGLVLVQLGDMLANHEFHLGSATFTMDQSTVGTFIIAIITSLPELIVTLAAFRLGSVDMALGNLFGSNMCNMGIVGLVALAYRKGSVFAACSPIHIVTGLTGISLTVVAMIGLMVRGKKSLFFLGWDVIAMILLYILGLLAVITAGVG